MCKYLPPQMVYARQADGVLPAAHASAAVGVQGVCWHGLKIVIGWN